MLSGVPAEDGYVEFGYDFPDGPKLKYKETFELGCADQAQKQLRWGNLMSVMLMLMLLKARGTVTPRRSCLLVEYIRLLFDVAYARDFETSANKNV